MPFRHKPKQFALIRVMQRLPTDTTANIKRQITRINANSSCPLHLRFPDNTFRAFFEKAAESGDFALKKRHKILFLH